MPRRGLVEAHHHEQLEEQEQRRAEPQEKVAGNHLQLPRLLCSTSNNR